MLGNAKKITLITAVSLFFAFTAFRISVVPGMSDQKNAVIREGLRLVYSSQYEEAIHHFRMLEEIDPGCAESTFFEAFVLELVMDIFRSQKFDDSLKTVTDKGIERAKAAVKKNPAARNYMFLGGVYGVRGVRKGILGDWFGAARDGRRAFKNMEKAVKIDTSIYDCYYGIGSYHYWKTKKLRRFFWFLEDQRQQGIDELYLSIGKGIFAKTPGRMALFRIYIEEKMYDKVIDLADVVLKENPDHVFPRWYFGIALVRTGQWQKALENYKIIYDYLPKIAFRGIEADIEARYYMGLSYYNLGNLERAKEMIESLDQYDKKVNKHLFYYADYIKESRSLLKKIDKALASGK